MLRELEELNEICRNKTKVAVFGAGKIAKRCIRYLKRNSIGLSYIIVSNCAGNPDCILGIPVKTIDQFEKDELSSMSLLICVSEAKQDSVATSIENYLFDEIYYLSDHLTDVLKYQDIDSYEEILDIVENNSIKIDENLNKLLRFVKKPCLEYMIVNILDHCNLRCKGCDHFACIADEKYYKRASIRRDLERMSKLFNKDYIMKIAVMGGEPLLHPELKEILSDVRECFPYTTIRLTTNGLLLMKQDDDFWRVCRENRVTIVNTKYPINLDFEAMKAKAESEGVTFQFFEGTGGETVKRSFKKIINLEGNSNPVEAFANCSISNYGNILLDGKFYGCPFSVQSYRIFNKRFDKNLRLTEEDYIDIYMAKNKEEFLEFAARPKYYCRYCSGRSEEFPWTRSKQEIDEWV